MKRMPDFQGYASKSGILCSDGRTILAHAFKEQDGTKVPLVWSHIHDDPSNVLGHAILENREDGTYVYCYLNDGEKAQDAKAAIIHGDVNAMSIWANRLVENAKRVTRGVIREVSLVLAGANPGAFIDKINLAHSADGTDLFDEAIIYTGLSLEHSSIEDNETNEGDNVADENLSHEDDSEETVGDIVNTFTDKQRGALNYLLSEALAHAEGDEDEDEEETDEENSSEDAEDEGVEHSDSDDENLSHSDQEDTHMKNNVFEQNGPTAGGATLSHSEMSTILSDGQAMGSFKKGYLAHEEPYGIEDINLLFPDAKATDNTPAFWKRRTEWVNVVLSGTKHVPFAKIKTVQADLTADEARAKGYVKGNLKKDEVITLLKRTTGPTTIYKKQRLDRDDIVDITDFEVVSWLWTEIRLMLEEELARAILIGDGRSPSSEDKIKDPAGATDGNGIRSIMNDDDFYAHKVALAANVGGGDAVKGIVRSRTEFRGTGKPTLFVSSNFLTDIMLLEDKMGRPLYDTEAILADKLRVDKIVTVDLFDTVPSLLGILVNLADYSIGTNKGGELTKFEDFDIDYNQNKFLLETRLSGALTRPKSAIVITRDEGTAVTPQAPSFDGDTNTITIPNQTGVIYLVDGEVETGSVQITEDAEVTAIADDDYYIPAGSVTNWSFTYTG